MELMGYVVLTALAFVAAFLSSSVLVLLSKGVVAVFAEAPIMFMITLTIVLWIVYSISIFKD